MLFPNSDAQKACAYSSSPNSKSRNDGNVTSSDGWNGTCDVKSG